MASSRSARDLGGHARIVHQHVQAAEMLANLGEHRCAGGRLGHVAPAVEHLGAEFADLLQRLCSRIRLAHAADGQVETFGSKTFARRPGRSPARRR